MIAFGPILVAAKSWGVKAGAFILGSRAAQIAIVTALVLFAVRCHYEGIQSDLEAAQNGRKVAESNLAECQEASRTQQATIRRLELAEQENAERYLAEARRSERQAERITELEQQQQGRNRDEIDDAIDESRGDECGSAPMPDGLRLRVRP